VAEKIRIRTCSYFQSMISNEGVQSAGVDNLPERTNRQTWRESETTRTTDRLAHGHRGLLIKELVVTGRKTLSLCVRESAVKRSFSGSSTGREVYLAGDFRSPPLRIGSLRAPIASLAAWPTSPCRSLFSMPHLSKIGSSRYYSTERLASRLRFL